MSLKHKLEKVGSLKEAQLLFNNEVSRLKRLDVYKESESRLNGRIDKLKNDIDSYLIEHDIDGKVKINNDDYFFNKTVCWYLYLEYIVFRYGCLFESK